MSTSFDYSLLLLLELVLTTLVVSLLVQEHELPRRRTSFPLPRRVPQTSFQLEIDKNASQEPLLDDVMTSLHYDLQNEGRPRLSTSLTTENATTIRRASGAGFAFLSPSMQPNVAFEAPPLVHAFPPSPSAEEWAGHETRPHRTSPPPFQPSKGHRFFLSSLPTTTISLFLFFITHLFTLNTDMIPQVQLGQTSIKVGNV